MAIYFNCIFVCNFCAIIKQINSISVWCVESVVFTVVVNQQPSICKRCESNCNKKREMFVCLIIYNINFGAAEAAAAAKNHKCKKKEIM